MLQSIYFNKTKNIQSMILILYLKRFRYSKFLFTFHICYIFFTQEKKQKSFCENEIRLLATSAMKLLLSWVVSVSLSSSVVKNVNDIIALWTNQ